MKKTILNISESGTFQGLVCFKKECAGIVFN